MRLIYSAMLVVVGSYASSCNFDSTAPICQWADKVTVAFTWTVTEAGPAVRRQPLWYRVRVNDRLRGVDGNIGDVVVAAGDSLSYSRIYTIGQQYLFAAFKFVDPVTAGKLLPQLPPGVPVIGGYMCSLHRPVERSAEDIAFLREPPVAARIYGSVHAGGWSITSFTRSYPPLAGAVIQASASAVDLRTKSDVHGQFEFGNVMPGRYTISATLPRYRMEAPIEVDVPVNGCAAAFISMSNNAVLSGRVVDFEGRPARGLAVLALLPDSRLPAFPSPVPALTRQDGPSSCQTLHLATWSSLCEVRSRSACQQRTGRACLIARRQASYGCYRTRVNPS